MKKRFIQNGEAGRRGARPGAAAAPSGLGPKGKRARRQRGVALMVALISIAVLTAVATEFLYTSRVDLQMAGNQRDDVRAYYLARSGVGLARLMLSFQTQVDNIKLPPGLGALMGMAEPPTAPGAPGAAPAPTGFNIQLWKLARIDCYLLQSMIVSEEDDAAGRVAASLGSRRAASEEDEELDEVPGGQRQFGSFTGCFDVEIEAEESKINLNALDVNQSVFQALSILGDRQFEFLFEREDSNRVRVTPTDLLIHIHDWTDPNKVASTLDLSGPLPFLQGFSDEDGDYSRYTPRYQAKNAAFDSLDELYMVHGVNDRIMNVLRDRVTVYPDKNRGANINTDDPFLLLRAVAAAIDPARPDPRLRDPVFQAQLIQAIQMARMFSFLGTSSADFVNILKAQGLAVRSDAAQKYLSDKNNTYTIKAKGEAGAIKKTITAVVRMDKGKLGQLVYWREE